MGASASYLPDYARGERLDPDDISSEQSAEATNKGVLEEEVEHRKSLQKLEEEKRKAMVIPLIQSMYRTYIVNSSIALGAECKATVHKRKTVFTLNITPFLKLHPSEIKVDIESHSANFLQGGDQQQQQLQTGLNSKWLHQLPKLYRVTGLEFEIPNMHEIMKLGGCVTVSQPTEDNVIPDDFPPPPPPPPPPSGNQNIHGQIGETVYLHPLDITVLNTISHLQIPLTLKMSNIFFTREEVDQMMFAKTHREAIQSAWRTQNPLSSGALRKCVPKVFIGDVFANYNRMYANNMCSPCYHGPHRYNVEGGCKVCIGETQATTEEEEEEEEGEVAEENESPMFYVDSMVSTRYLCPSTGNHLADMRQFKRVHEQGAGNNFKDLVIYVPPIGTIGDILQQQKHQSPTTHHVHLKESTVVYKSIISASAIYSNYITPKEYLISRISHLDLSTSMDTRTGNIDGLHTLVKDQDFSILEGTKEHLFALETVMTFMHSHEFFLGSDYMFTTCNNVNRKRRAQKLAAESNSTSLPPGFQEPVQISYVGKLKHNEVVVEMGEEANYVFNRLNQQQQQQSGNSLFDSTPSSENHSGDHSTNISQNIYAIPSELCESIRSQLEAGVYQKMKFCDFSNPIIEVNTDESMTSSYIEELENYINSSIWIQILQQKRLNPKATLHDPTNGPSEQPLLPIIITLEMNYLEIRHPNTLN